MREILHRIFAYLFIYLLITPSTAFAYSYYSRFTFGSFISREHFVQSLDGQNNNDFATLSARLFFHAQDIGDQKFELNVDVRDKHDFFEKLDRQLLLLGPENTLQVRRLSLKLPNESGRFFTEVGRFPVPQAGGIHLDGGLAGWRWSPELYTGLFGGLNPKTTEQEYLTFNSQANTIGLFTTYQPPSLNWNRHLYWSATMASENHSGHLDRVFLYQNLLYQWSIPNQILALITVDFVPRTYIQNGILSWNQQWSEPWSSEISMSTIDVIQYSRNQDLLEVLDPSPYHEVKAKFNLKLNSKLHLRSRISHGIRENDSLKRTEFTFGPLWPQWLDKHATGQILLGFRKNFSSEDQLIRGSIGYFSKLWEVDFSGEYGLRSEISGTLYHTTSLELGVTRQFSKQFMGTVFIQKASDERVDIYSLSLKIGYRFSNAPIPPLREGNPPRGKL